MNPQLTASDRMEERAPKLIPARQRDIRSMLNKCKPYSESGWWILQWDPVVLLLFPLRSLERLAAVKCAMIEFECNSAFCSSAWLKGGTDTVARLPSAGCELLYTSATFTSILLCLSFLPLRWLFYKSTCIVYAFCGVLFGLCSLSNLTVLSCVCWLKVCCPNYGKNNTTTSRVCSSVNAQGSWCYYWWRFALLCNVSCETGYWHFTMTGLATRAQIPD